MMDFERWIYVLKNMETLNRLPFRARKSVFDKLEKIVDIAALSKDEREKYDESIKVYRDNLAVMAFERQEGYEEGYEEGLKEGRKEGILAAAYNFKKMGMELDQIAKGTGLSIEEITKL